MAPGVSATVQCNNTSSLLLQEQFVIQTPAREQFPKSLSSHTAYPDIVWVAVENADIVLSFCAFAHEWRLRGICSCHACQGSHRQAEGSKLHLFYVFSGLGEQNGTALCVRRVSLSALLLGQHNGLSSHRQDSAKHRPVSSRNDH